VLILHAILINTYLVLKMLRYSY